MRATRAERLTFRTYVVRAWVGGTSVTGLKIYKFRCLQNVLPQAGACEVCVGRVAAVTNFGLASGKLVLATFAPASFPRTTAQVKKLYLLHRRLQSSTG